MTMTAQEHIRAACRAIKRDRLERELTAANNAVNGYGHMLEVAKTYAMEYELERIQHRLEEAEEELEDWYNRAHEAGFGPEDFETFA